MKDRIAAILAGCLIALVGGASEAAVWRVEKDGSGDFTLIQDAIDTAAAGDTVSIGVGFWQETHEVELPGGTATLIARVEQIELTILGAGSDVTSISVPEGPGRFDSPQGIVTGVNTLLRAADIRFENLREGVLANGPAVVIDGCDFRNNFIGLGCWTTDSTRVRQSTFFNNSNRGVIVVRNLGAKDVLIESCTFEEGGAEIALQSQSSVVRNCTFTKSGVGVQTSLGGQARVQDCQFAATYNWGVALLDGSSMELLNCRFQSSAGGDVHVSNGSQLEGFGNVVGGGSVYTLSVVLSATLDFHGNHILNGGGISVELYGGSQATRVFDLSNNYWGTTDPAQIDEWILDMNDNEHINGIVEYDPFAPGPIATQAKSFGELKALFSRDQDPE